MNIDTTEQPPVTDPSHNLTRKFALVAGLIVLVAGVVLGTVQFIHFQNQVRMLANTDRQAITRVIANEIWDISDQIQARLNVNFPSGDLPEKITRSLDAEVRRMIAGTPVIKVRLFDSGGVVRYSTSPNEVNNVRGSSSGFRDAMKGRSGSVYEPRPRFDGINGILQNAWISSHYLPRIDETTGAVTLIAEVYGDISSRRALVRSVAMENIAISIAMLLLIYTLLLTVVYQAVRLVRREHRRALALASAMTQAEAANQSKTAFLANMSHELRTPLNAIIGFAEIMGSEIKGPLGDESYKGYVRDIGKAGRHLLGIIDRVLDLVRAETGAVLLDVRATNIVFVCESIARMLSAEAENSGLDLSVTATEDPLVIDTDAGKLRDILTGLVSNSIKFTPSGGHVSIGIEREGTGARISVIDDGIGISAEDMPTAAAPFGHLENVYAKTHGGVGLGLPLARKLTELLDGSFEVSPNPKGGTIVSISLPHRPSGIPANDAHASETSSESAP